jgi:hypothetical protein
MRSTEFDERAARSSQSTLDQASVSYLRELHGERGC